MNFKDSPIKGAIFDVDGLLLDSEPIFVKACEETTGHPMTTEQHIQLLGRNSHDCGIIMTKMYNIQEDPDEFMVRLNSKLRELLPEAELMKGAKEIVSGFIQRNIPLALATGSSKLNYGAKISRHLDFFNQFNSTTVGDEVTHGKPNPEIFLIAMKKLGIDDPSSILVFEDSPGGVKCANNAGVLKFRLKNR